MPGDAASLRIAQINADAGLQQAQIGADASMANAKTGANASMYGADQGLAGQKYGADSRLAGDMAQTDMQRDAYANREAGEMSRAKMAQDTSILNTGITNSPSKATDSAIESAAGRYMKPRLAHGTARVPGQGDGTVDTVDAKLAPGEAVLNKAAAEMLGRGLIDLLNKHGMLKMGMPDPKEEAAEGEPGYACGTSNVHHYATGTSNVGNDPSAFLRSQGIGVAAPAPAPTPAPAPQGRSMAQYEAALGMPPAPPPVDRIPTIDHGPAPIAPVSPIPAQNASTPPQTMLSATPPRQPAPAPQGRSMAQYEASLGFPSTPAPAAPPAPAPQGRSMAQYESDVFGGPSAPPRPAAPQQPAINNNMSFDEAFAAARKAFGGSDNGAFEWTNPRTHQSGIYNTKMARR